MTMTRSSGEMSFRTNAAAPALIASNRASSSSSVESTTMAVAGSSRLIRWVVSMPPGAGSERSMRITSGLVAKAASSADRGSSASATISMSGSRSRIWRMPTRNSAWSSTIRTLTRS
jgi:hypothetical protein